MDICQCSGSSPSDLILKSAPTKQGNPGPTFPASFGKFSTLPSLFFQKKPPFIPRFQSWDERRLCSVPSSEGA
jgi:hypothetical protein